MDDVFASFLDKVVVIELLLPLPSVAQLPATRRKLLEHLLWIILLTHRLQIVDVSLAVASNGVLVCIGVVDVLPITVCAWHALGIFGDVGQDVVNDFLNEFVLGRVVPDNQEVQEDTVILDAIEPKNVATLLNAVLREHSRDGLELRLREHVWSRTFSGIRLESVLDDAIDVRQDRRVGLEDDGAVDVAHAVHAVELVGEVVERVDAQGAGYGRAERLGEILQRLGEGPGGVGGCVVFLGGGVAGVFIEIDERRFVACAVVLRDRDDRAVGVVDEVVCEFHEGLECLVEVGEGVHCDTAPERAVGEGYEVEAGDEPEVAGAAFEAFEEVGVLFRIGVCDCAVAEDDLEVLDVVAHEAVARCEEGVSAAEGQACDTDLGGTATWDGDSSRGKKAVDVAPCGAGLNGCGGIVFVECGVLHQTQVYRDSILDSVGADVKHVPTTFDGELALVRGEGGDDY